jgi:prevent-host-death family protein
MTTAHLFSSREFTRDVAAAKQAACDGPVFITDRGAPAHVLLTIDEYRRLTGAERSLADALAMPSAEGIEFEPPKIQIGLKVPDFLDDEGRGA